MGKTLHAVVFVLYRAEDGGAVLMEWREDGVFAPGHWSFPGGRIEPGEDAPDTLIREASEELAVKILTAIPMHDYTYKGFAMLPYLVTRWEGDPPPSTLDVGHRLQWFTPDAACEVPWPPAAFFAEQARALIGALEQLP